MDREGDPVTGCERRPAGVNTTTSHLVDVRVVLIRCSTEFGPGCVRAGQGRTNDNHRTRIGLNRPILASVGVRVGVIPRRPRPLENVARRASSSMASCDQQLAMAWGDRTWFAWL